jgi:hypothetical protein
MQTRLLLTTLVLAAAVAGCERANPTAPVVPNGPSYDGGWTIGSGGRSDTTTTPPSNTSTTGETLCVSSTEDGGGWTIGSGGVAHQGAGQCEGQ